MSDLEQLLRELCAIPAPSGREEPVRRVLLDRWSDRSEEITVDGVGNVLARVTTGGPKLLLHAHMDEISYVVRSITDDGFLMLDTGQGRRREGPELRHMIGRDVTVVASGGVQLDGLIAAPAGHVLTREQLDAPRPGWDDFFVDLGVESRAEAEELGVHGARAVAANHRFDAAIALDVGLVGDVPGVGRSEYEATLGGGPTIVHKDALAFYDARLVDSLLGVARRNAIPVQHGVYAGYGSDGVPFLDAGTRSALVAIPTRYTHTAFEMVDPRDVLGTVRLLEAFTTTPIEGES